jgi:hypothetical protein
MTEAAIVALLACCVALVRALVRERRARRYAEATSSGWRRLAAFYRDAYDGTIYKRSRSNVSEAREGYATFSTVDEITSPVTSKGRET